VGKCRRTSTDPKVGGHPAACASSLDFLAALHLVVREPGDFFACKPHGSPVDHALHHALGLFRHGAGGAWFDEAESEAVMARLRRLRLATESHDGIVVADVGRLQDFVEFLEMPQKVGGEG